MKGLAVAVCLLALTAAPAIAAPAPPSDVAAPPADARKTPSGLVSKVVARGSGTRHPGPNDCVKVHYTAWTRQGQLAGSSSQYETTTETIPALQCLRRMSPGIAEAVTAMVTGERRRIWIPQALAFPPDPTEEAPARAEDLTYDLALVEIVSAPPTPPSLRVPPKRANKTASGVAVQLLKKGTGKIHPATPGRVKLQLSGWTSAGVLFESTVTAGQAVSYGLDELIPGLREAIPLLVVGDRARIWVPAALAYGEKPRRRGQPAGNLIYDIEVLALE
jgi:peptidylprolyl isomerase